MSGSHLNLLPLYGLHGPVCNCLSAGASAVPLNNYLNFSCFSILEPLAATLPVISFLKRRGRGEGGGGGCYFFRLVKSGDVKKDSYDCCWGMWKNDAHLKNIACPSCSIHNKYSLIQHSIDGLTIRMCCMCVCRREGVGYVVWARVLLCLIL